MNKHDYYVEKDSVKSNEWDNSRLRVNGGTAPDNCQRTSWAVSMKNIEQAGPGM